MNIGSISRRSLLLGGLALLSSTALTPLSVAFAETPFSFDALTDRVRALARDAYVPVAATIPAALQTLDYDGYRKIQFATENASWLGDPGAYQVQAYHLGWLYLEPVKLYGVAGSAVEPIEFGAQDFRYMDAAAGAVADEGFPGVAGFRINYPLNRPEVFDELISFLGASYFRALGRGNVYGASARGLVVNAWRDGPEEFPRFSEFYMENPAPGSPLAINAVLDSPSVAGAYRFEIVPGSEERPETVIDVTARLFFRTDVAEAGVAPLTSMFLFGEVNRSAFDDYRPQVHDSTGLLIEQESGDVLWRALGNTAMLGNSYLWENNPRAFGLYQRGRDFESYQDAGAHYERRPSVRIEPLGQWGQGTVRLIEIPAKLEADDNIVAFWVPATAPKAGEEREYRYRLIWGDLEPESALGHVAETRGGIGGFAGVDNVPTLRKFVVDFKGGELDAIADGTPIDLLATASAGQLTASTVSRIAEAGVWRVVLDIDTGGVTEPIELKAYLVGLGRKLTETWLYQWRAGA